MRTSEQTMTEHLPMRGREPLPEEGPRPGTINATENGRERLRVALIAGTLVQDGAEKQLVYMARALHAKGVDVRVHSLTRGEHYERDLIALGLPPCWVGERCGRARRLLAVAAAMRQFRPHIVQATHFFTNLYAIFGARACGALAIGCCRNDVLSEVADCGRWGKWSLHWSPVLLVNSRAAKQNAAQLGYPTDRVHVLDNAIDLAAFAAAQAEDVPSFGGRPVAIAIGRLVPQKRFDVFLQALARARESVPTLKGLIVGEGPDRSDLEKMAGSLSLLPDHVEFLGRRKDVPALLCAADVLVLTSAYEGFPNVILEAMAAARPVITTLAGDSSSIVQYGTTGWLVPFNDPLSLAERLVRLLREPGLGKRYGEAGRRRVEKNYGFAGLAERLLAIYERMGQQLHRKDLLRLLHGKLARSASEGSPSLALRANRGGLEA
jgi:glycosyltransferase involved in cell wall biosynthesis